MLTLPQSNGRNWCHSDLPRIQIPSSKIFSIQIDTASDARLCDRDSTPCGRGSQSPAERRWTTLVSLSLAVSLSRSKMVNANDDFGQNRSFSVPLRKVLTCSCYANGYIKIEAFLTDPVASRTA